MKYVDEKKSYPPFPTEFPGSTHERNTLAPYRWTKPILPWCVLFVSCLTSIAHMTNKALDSLRLLLLKHINMVFLIIFMSIMCTPVGGSECSSGKVKHFIHNVLINVFFFLSCKYCNRSRPYICSFVCHVSY